MEGSDNSNKHTKHRKFQEGIQYLYENKLSKLLSKADKARLHRVKLAGIEVRRLLPDHPIYKFSDKEEYGLFASKSFEQFDIIGEYCGRVVSMNDTEVNTNSSNSRYLACFDYCSSGPMKTDSYDTNRIDFVKSLCVDAQDEGNELRYINSYLNISTTPNVLMRTIYVNRNEVGSDGKAVYTSYPSIIVMCTRDIQCGEEFLLDYGDEYNRAYLTSSVPEDAYNTENSEQALV